MTATRSTRSTMLALACAALLSAGCGPQAGGPTVTPGGTGTGGTDPDPQGTNEGATTNRIRTVAVDRPAAAAVPRAHPLDQRHATVFVERVDRIPEGGAYVRRLRST